MRPRTVALVRYALTGEGSFQDDIRDVSGGEMFGVLTFKDASGRVVGAVDYSVYQDQANIKYIQVVPEFQRRNIGKRLIARLQVAYPKRPVYWGSTTDAGSRLRRSYNRLLKTLG